MAGPSGGWRRSRTDGTTTITMIESGFSAFSTVRDDQEAANGLFERAEGWLGDRGLYSVRGPVSPSMHHECGVLVDGFDFPPMIMTPWNPSYYDSLIERAGYARARDLLGYHLPVGDELALPERVRRLAERTLQKTGLVFREWDFGTMEEQVRDALDLYCDAWDGNWGFVPPSWEEFWHLAKGPEVRPASGFCLHCGTRR